jgi:hypothetical protein
MAADRSDDRDVPSWDRHDGSPSDSSDSSDSSDGAGGRVAVESRDRCEYYEALRAAAVAGADSPESVQDSCDTAAERFREKWAAHCEKWPADGRSAVDRSKDPPGSWRGESGRFLDSAANMEVEERCERIGEVERTIVSPVMREIEGCDPDRRLVGFQHRLKGLDRLKDKVAADIEEKGRTVPEALSLVPDTIRFTLQYDIARYAQGVRVDIERIADHGYELVKLKNYWACDQYKGINTQWIDRGTGRRFEIQFHTAESFEAKQLTHSAYERLRCGRLGAEEEGELEELQRETTSKIPAPSNVDDVRDYPERGENAG